MTRAPLNSSAAFVMVVAVTAFSTTAYYCSYAFPTAMPIERLITNTEAWIAENPGEHEGHGTLARIHSYALRYNKAALGVFQRRDFDPTEELLQVSDHAQGLMFTRPGQEDLPLELQQRIHHADQAATQYALAITLEPESAVYHLGYAYSLELAAPMAGLLQVVPLDPTAEQQPPSDAALASMDALIAGNLSAIDRVRSELVACAPGLLAALGEVETEAARAAVMALLEEHWRNIALEHYLRAFEHAFEEDAATESIFTDTGRTDLISYEAAISARRLCADRMPPKESPLGLRLANAAEGIEKLESIEMVHFITPVVFSSDHPATLPDLLSDHTAVFDLDGDGLQEDWPWVQPDTAILVWDPDRTGEITSGRQLFGSVTWWLFFPDGYRAMDLLDDNRDGWLRGDELLGMALWFDRDSNGISDPGEVIPIEHTTVAALATHWESKIGRSMANNSGLELKDGRLLPTYDWVAQRAPAPEQAVNEETSHP